MVLGPQRFTRSRRVKSLQGDLKGSAHEFIRWAIYVVQHPFPGVDG